MTSNDDVYNWRLCIASIAGGIAHMALKSVIDDMWTAIAWSH